MFSGLGAIYEDVVVPQMVFIMLIFFMPHGTVSHCALHYCNVLKSSTATSSPLGSSVLYSWYKC